MNKYRELKRKANKMCRDFVKWIWEQCKDWKTVALLGVVSLVMYSPALAGWAAGAILGWDWAWISATAYAAFWIGPFSPFFGIAVAITLFIKRTVQLIFKKKEQKSAEDGKEQKSAEDETSSDGN